MSDMEFASLTLVKGGRRILDDIAGRFRRGEVTAILGANGAGKSSLLHCLAGLERPASGDVRLGGFPVGHMKAGDRARVIGFLPQRSEIHWNMAVQALVALGRSAHNGGGRLTRADQTVLASVMAAMDIAHLAQRPAGRLSGGEQARVLLARVLAGEPQWLLADEPLASLDPAHQITVLRHLRDAANAGAGVAVVLHDVNLAARIADHVVLMKEGRIIADGRCDEVLTPEELGRAFDVPFRRIADERLMLTPSG